MSIAEQAELARDAVATFAYRNGKSDDPLKEQIVGLVTALFHLAVLDGINLGSFFIESNDEHIAVLTPRGEPTE